MDAAVQPSDEIDEATLNVGTVGYRPGEAAGKTPVYGTFTDMYCFGRVLYEFANYGLPKGGRNTWFAKSDSVFKLRKDDIGGKLENLIKNLTKPEPEHQERISATDALEEVKAIIEDVDELLPKPKEE